MKLAVDLFEMLLIADAGWEIHISVAANKIGMASHLAE